MTMLAFVIAAVLEIAGCFAFWSWLRGDGGRWLAIPGVLCLIAFAICLTRVDSAAAGRAYAAYGGIYIATALVWLRVIEGVPPDRWDLVGALVSVGGALIIILGPR